MTTVKGDHPKLLFGDDLPKDISETNRLDSVLLRKPNVSFHSSKILKQPSMGNSLLYQGRDQEEDTEKGINTNQYGPTNQSRNMAPQNKNQR